MSALGAKCCPSCSWKGKSLNQHYYNSPQCKPPPKPPPPSEQPVDTSWADSLLTNTFRSTLAQQILEMHADNYMTNAMVDRAVSLMCKAVESTLKTCEERVARDSPAAVPVLAPVAVAVRKVTSGFLDSSNTIAFAMTTQIGFIPPMENPLEKDRVTKGELTKVIACLADARVTDGSVQADPDRRGGLDEAWHELKEAPAVHERHACVAQQLAHGNVRVVRAQVRRGPAVGRLDELDQRGVIDAPSRAEASASRGSTSPARRAAPRTLQRRAQRRPPGRG